MQRHLDQWHKDAKQRIDQHRPLLLRIGLGNTGSLRVQDSRQPSQYAEEGHGKAHLRSDLQLDFDIAETDAIVVVREVERAGVPEDAIEGVEEEQEDGPRYEEGQTDVAVADVPTEGASDKQDQQQAGSCEKDAEWVWRC